MPEETVDARLLFRLCCAWSVGVIGELAHEEAALSFVMCRLPSELFSSPR